MNVANDGQVFEEVDVSSAPEEAGEETNTDEAGAPDGSEANTESVTGPVEEVTTKTEAAQHLMGELDVPKESLTTEKGNISKVEIEDVAEDFGITFPNL